MQINLFYISLSSSVHKPLEFLYEGKAVAETVAVSNSTKKVSKSTDGATEQKLYVSMDLQFFAEKSIILYRGDCATPTEVFKNGFKPRGIHNVPLLHNKYNSMSGNYVSTSRKMEVADAYATGGGVEDGYVYIIHAKSYINMNTTYGKDVAHPHDYEFLIEGAIPISKKMMYGSFIPNPNYGGN
ncbi:MAG: enterotoxin A family protein [Lachnospiraceae bacterium]|nr:enterotoxin A family protein [Lachnospiraceae bacterium]